MNLQTFPDSESLTTAFAEWLISYIEKVLSKQERFTIALSGGNTPKRLYELLASRSHRSRISWDKLHFFWGDERFVPADDKRNNAKMARETLLDNVPVNWKQVHMMPVTGEPDATAEEYEKLLHYYFDGSSQSFDLVLLGLGDNAHTLSLFPGYDVVHEQEKWVTAFYLREQEMYRITLTAPVVNLAGRVAFLVSGGDKAAAVYHIIASEHDPGLYPGQIIQPFNSELYWFCDEAAAADL